VPWSNVTVSDSQIFLLFNTWNGRLVQKIAVLSMDGSEQKIIDLEPYFPRIFELAHVFSDRRGGVFVILFPIGYVHFDVDSRPYMVPLGTDWPYFSTILGWDKQLYRYDNDQVYHWKVSENADISKRQPDGAHDNVISSTSVESADTIHLLGADFDGRMYFYFHSQGNDWWLARLDNTGKRGIIGKLLDEWWLSVFAPQLAPDGSFYSLIYDRKDISINPAIVKCDFKP
jgi:hypothetical protein